MNLKILCAESLGVRGMACLVESGRRKICIDPGISLGYSRYGLAPHPFQIAVGRGIREKILSDLNEVTDVVFSHFDGDHCPLKHPNPYQLGLEEVRFDLCRCRVFAKGPLYSSPTQQARRNDLAVALNRGLPAADGTEEDLLAFSPPVSHGESGDDNRTVIMTRVKAEGLTFVHASDIQFLEAKAVQLILDWEPDIVFASGPPIYHYAPGSVKAERKIQIARENVLHLSRNVNTLIMDHHLLRSAEGIQWLNQMKTESPNPIVCAADFMKRQPVFLEAQRKDLYNWIPVPDQWHETYERDPADPARFRKDGWKALIQNGIIQPCKWYSVCPMRGFTEAGKLEVYWTEHYCLVGSTACVRYQMEEREEFHPDNLLPDGTIREDLKAS